MGYPSYRALKLAGSVFIAVAAAAGFTLSFVVAAPFGPQEESPAHREATPQSAEASISLSPTELGIYRRARTLMDWTPKEIKEYPSLGKLRTEVGADELPLTMKRVGERAAATISEFRNVACEERVYSEWNVGSPIATWREMGPNEVAHHFLYLILSRPAGNSQIFTEYRSDPRGNPVDLATVPDLPLITANFAGSWAYFNSSNQSESDFRYFGEEPIRKQMCYVVGFAQKPEIARNLTSFEFGKQHAVILVQGLAWIDETAFQIVKIETWLLAPRDDIGLKSQDTAVNYSPVSLSRLTHAVWLPSDVTVLVHYHNLFVRNTHRYSRFKLFEVNVVTNSERSDKVRKKGSKGGISGGKCR